MIVATIHAERKSAEMLNQYLSPALPYMAGEITDLCINRPLELWTRDAEGWHRHHAPDLTYQHCSTLATTIASYRGKPTMPILSATLEGGERVQVISGVACEPRKVIIAIRKPGGSERTLEQLDESGAFSDCHDRPSGLQAFESQLLALKKNGRIREFLDLAVRMKRNILISGKTGSGKTTLSNALIGCIPLGERIVTIEDERELLIRDAGNARNRQCAHLLYSRDEDAGVKVTAEQALAASLRMAPDRIILQEIRGPEAWVYVKSMGTGHPGQIATIHAESADQTIEQLASHVKDSRTGAHLEMDYIRRRLVGSIDIVLYMENHKLKGIYYAPESKRLALV